jgi:hypothetical protein
MPAKMARITGRIRALIAAMAITASTIVRRSSAVRPGMIAIVNQSATKPTRSETIARLMSAQRPARQFQSS